MTATSSPPIGRLLFGAGVLTLFVASCSRGERALGESLGGGTEQNGGFVAPPDASADGDASDTLISYCPSNKCPAGYTTCPGSRFPCDVNLGHDRDNCGACGAACPPNTTRETYECVEGRCELKCRTYPLTLDCDGVVDNGCETDPGTNDNCSACGDRCLDPAKPCVNPTLIGGSPKCGCDADRIYCEQGFPTFCVDPKTNDFNCGSCGTRCPATGGVGAEPPPPNMYYGCDEGQCGALKCNQNYANCDGKIDNGCETKLSTAENCGICGNACPAGTKCTGDAIGQPFCACPPGQTYCASGCFGDSCTGECVDLASDANNCGACGLRCGDAFATQTFSVCSYGICNTRCSQGRADCNGNSGDDCEVDINSDPRNCGGCGITCDAIAGQACVGGRCVVEPCTEDAGPGETR